MAVVVLSLALVAYMVFHSVTAQASTAVRPLTISQIDYNDNGTVTLRATFPNFRACKSIGIAWYVGPEECSFDQASLVLTK